MCKGNPEHTFHFAKNLWDAAFRDSNVMIILCGSAMSFIEKELLAEKNPLYGRATGIYKMREMGFYDAVKFFPDYSDYDKVLCVCRPRRNTPLSASVESEAFSGREYQTEHSDKRAVFFTAR